ncbi:MAG: hypothetical protein KA275_08440 [Chitinophagaceae bacterium]|nr:hypothetical protein [Chitinophagaceae bacterium]
MKKVIIKTIIFLFILSSLLILLLLVSNNVIKNKVFVKINPKSEFIIIGHSHPEVALNDSLIDNFSNCAASAESYFYSYQKLKKIIEQNKNIKVVFIEFSNNQINEEINNWIWDDEHLSVRYPRYAPLLDFKEHKILLEKNPSGFVNALSLSLNRNLNNLLYRNYDFSALRNGYLKKHGSKVDSLIKALYTKPCLEKSMGGTSVVNIEYLKKIIKFCNEQNKKVFLMRCPLHRMYPMLSNEKIYRNYVLDTFSKTEYLDFKDFPLKDSDFYDFDHLNVHGAIKFSVFFNNLIKDGLLESTDKQKFIYEQQIEGTKEK